MSPIAEVGSAFVSVMPSTKGFGSKLDSEVSGDLKSSGSKAGKVFGGALKLGALGVLAGAAVVGNFLKGSLDEAREAQKVGALTESTIKATGAAAGVTAKQVSDLAGAISLKTGIDDETIQSGENMLLTFKNIRNEVGKGNDIFDQSTETLVDLSAAMGTEPKQAAIQLGKALNDPIKGISALSRVGVTFTDGQKKVIEGLVETGDTAGAQKVILRELNSEFGGAAEAQATAGDQMRVAWGNLQESAGNALLPIVDAILPKLTSGINWLAKKGVPAIQGFWDNLAPARDAIGKVADGVADVIGAIRGGNWGKAWDKAKDAAKDALGTQARLVGQFATQRLIPSIRDAITRAHDAWAKKWEGWWKDPEVSYKKSIASTKSFGQKLRDAAQDSAQNAAFAFIKALQQMPGATAHVGVNTIRAMQQAIKGMPGLGRQIAVSTAASFAHGLDGMPGAASSIGVQVLHAMQSGLSALAGIARGIGVQIVQGLIDGLQSMFGSLGGAANSMAQIIKDHLPGSPVKTGPLTSWNNGGAGKRLVRLLAEGLSDTRPVTAAMDRLSAGIAVRGPGVLAAAGAGGGGRAALTITNWDEGVGFIEYVADGRIHGANQLAGETARAM